MFLILEVDETGSGSRLLGGFDISGAKPLDSAIRVFLG
jgi:hypothetical protein